MITVDGLPLHPLVVHAVVVLLPLAAVGTLAMAARAGWRRSLGVPTLLVAVVGTAAVPVATLSGRQLAAQGGGGPLVAEHAARAAALLPTALTYVALLALTTYLALRSRGAAPAHGHQRSGSELQVTALGWLTAVVGVGVAGLVGWIGHSGAGAVWG
ncbi:DUF2231 domain-containing protein [Pseudonocardia sp.]|uniref:DUF2231 domain-containing protein n=1 Tax=Pseudonocardia sp. TaxID=60912 RepID=UPI00262A5C82|nr:DUF2231 domain-containing protein [Pseudonocardia sp.]